jgi:hypothetical protein
MASMAYCPSLLAWQQLMQTASANNKQLPAPLTGLQRSSLQQTAVQLTLQQQKAYAPPPQEHLALVLSRLLQHRQQ